MKHRNNIISVENKSISDFTLIFKGQSLVPSIAEVFIKMKVPFDDALLLLLLPAVLPVAVTVSARMLWHLRMADCILIFFFLTGVLQVWH